MSSGARESGGEYLRTSAVRPVVVVVVSVPVSALGSAEPASAIPAAEQCSSAVVPVVGDTVAFRPGGY
jgi:hypothetical protein